MAQERQFSERGCLRPGRVSARGRGLWFESLEARRLLVIVASGAANETAASLLAYDPNGPGDPDAPGFNNIGVSSTGSGSIVYLGGGWVITAKHVTIGNPSQFVSPGGVFFGNGQYFIDESSIRQLHDPVSGGLADLKVFKIYGDPDLPTILDGYLPTTVPPAAAHVYMVGNGLTRGDAHVWNVNTAVMPWDWTGGPSVYSGFFEVTPRKVRWGENNVYETNKFYDFGADSIRYFSTQFSNTLTHEAQGSVGDSGGPVFWKSGSKWLLGGIIITTTVYSGQPDSTAVFGNSNQTWVADLSKYRDEILSIAGVVGRQVFYNQSAFDGDNAAINTADDSAIAQDKIAYMPGGGMAAAESVTSYARGINGIMIDLASNHGSLSINDFTLKMSPQGVNVNNAPSTWVAAPAHLGFSVRPGAGEGESDRVEITWPAGAIVDRWLQVIVEGNDAAGGSNTNTGLANSDIFYFGNKVGDTFDVSVPGVFTTDATDQLQARFNQGVAVSTDNIFDFNRDALIDATDQLIARFNQGFLLSINISNPPAGPLPEGETSAGGESAVASGLASADVKEEGEAEAPPVAPLVARATDPQDALRKRVYELLAAAGDSKSPWPDDSLSAELESLVAELAGELEAPRLI
jgi:hypothetical protein